MPKALRRTDPRPVPAPHAQPEPAAGLADALDGAAPAASPPRALQARLTREFGGLGQPDPEPFVERWSPATSMLIVLGGGVMLWTVLAGVAHLAAR